MYGHKHPPHTADPPASSLRRFLFPQHVTIVLISNILKSQTLAGKMVPTQQEEDYSEDSQAVSEDLVRDSAQADHPLTISDITVIATEMKNTL